MRRGDIYQADLNPVQGSEQCGTRPVIIVSRDAINENSPVVIVVPTTGAENKSKLYPTHILLRAGTGGLTKDSIVLTEQVRAITKARLRVNMGQLRLEHMSLISAALKIAMDLP
jgi:mRNA interferase MazF